VKTKQSRAAKIRANSFDEETNTISIVWTTGAAVRRADYRGEEFDEVLSLEPGAVDLGRLNAGAPLLDSHQDGGVANIVGKIVEGSAKIEDGRGVATVVLSNASDVSDIVMKIREGTARNVSVGYWIEHTTRQDGDPPTVLVDRWTPVEVSIVTVPADAGAQIRSAGRSRPRDRQTPAQRAASYARGLLTQAKQTSAEARGAAEARSVLGNVGKIPNVPGVDKVGHRATAEFHKRDIEAGAREARRLLRGRK
jgi:HK97 family phage prohead protease